VVRVTGAAISRLRALLDSHAASPNQGIRLQPSRYSGQLGLWLDTPQPGDEVFRGDDTPLLILHPRVARQLRNTVVDVPSNTNDPHVEVGIVLRMDRSPN
jgi:hypothetical protein